MPSQNRRKNDDRSRDRVSHETRRSRRGRSGSRSPQRQKRSPRSSVSISISVSKTESSSSVSRSRSREKMNRYKPKNHENVVLVLDNINEEISQYQLEMILNESAVEMQVMPHDELNMLQAFGIAYVRYPNIESARKVLMHLKGNIQIGEYNVSVDFYDEQIPDSKRKKDSQSGPGGPKQLELKNSLMNQPPATSYDWICDKCQYENFAKRQKCNKCLNPRNSNCKILSVLITPPSNSAVTRYPPHDTSHAYHGNSRIDNSDTPYNTSLMIRGRSVIDATESEILDVFQSLASVKDIRLVPNKSTGGTKDFAFVEFFTIEDTENVYRRVSNGDYRIRGETITIQYSKSNRSQRYFDEQNAQQSQVTYTQQQASSLSGVGDLPSQSNLYDQQFLQQYNQQYQQYYFNQYQQQGQPMFQQPFYGGYGGQFYGQQPQGNQYPQQMQQHFQQKQMQEGFDAPIVETKIITQPQKQAAVTQIQQPTQQNENKTVMTPPPPVKSQPPKQEVIQIETQDTQPQKKQQQKEIQIQFSQQPLDLPPVEEETQVRPQTELDNRKKVEQEMKKWQKAQRAAAQSQPQGKTQTPQTGYKQTSSSQTKSQDKVTSQASVQVATSEEKTKLIICPICRKKFDSEEIQKLHEQFSTLHQNNLKKQN